MRGPCLLDVLFLVACQQPQIWQGSEHKLQSGCLIIMNVIIFIGQLICPHFLVFLFCFDYPCWLFCVSSLKRHKDGQPLQPSPNFYPGQLIRFLVLYILESSQKISIQLHLIP